MKQAELQRFFPVLKSSGIRLDFLISANDFNKIVFRGRGELGTVTDAVTGTRYKISGKPCGLDCHCDTWAEPVEDVTKSGTGV